MGKGRLAAGPQPHGAPGSARHVLGIPEDTGPFSAQLGAGQTPGELLNPLVLNSVLSKALQCSLHGDTPHASNLSLALKYLPEVFAPNAPDVLSCLELRYKVSSSPGHGDGTGAARGTPAEPCVPVGGLAAQRCHH